MAEKIVNQSDEIINISSSEIDLKSPIYISPKTMVLHYKDRTDQKQYVLKATGLQHPSSERISMVKHEYDILSSIKNDYVIKTYGLSKIENGLGILLENFPGKSLEEFAQLHRDDMPLLIRIFILAVEGIQSIHKNSIIHKDIKPQNMLVASDGKSIRIIDFDISTKTQFENFSGEEILKLEGTMSYISPEQTGRMNRTIDYRTDYYSLGVTFYEVFTGQKPFPETNDKLEMIHSHIARMPEPAKAKNPIVPKAVSDIINKLLEKRAEDRYQSSIGILNDLRLCLDKIKEQKDFSFTVAENDIPEKFIIPEKLYGREAEVLKIFNIFSSSLDVAEFLLISGISGSGKSFLVNEVQKPLSKGKGFFLNGKFDQLKRDIPYSALIDALEQFTNTLLTFSAEEIDFWKKSILNSLGSNAGILTQLVPDFELIIGEIPLPETLPPLESQNRFQKVIVNFLEIFSKSNIPVVFFFDDLQWADSSFINLVKKSVLEPELKNLLIIGAYRENEVKDTDPLSIMMNEVEKERIIHKIELTPLKEESIRNILTDSLYKKRTEIEELVPVIFQKTRGNAFFVIQFLKHLYKEKIIYLDSSDSGWNWNIDQVRNSSITENIVELLSSQLQYLEPESLSLLQLAACIGNVFTLKELSILETFSQSKIARLLEKPINEGFIIPLSKQYLYAAEADSNSDFIVSYRFQHDRIQQAAYELIPAEKRKEVHLQIAVSLYSAHQKEHSIEDSMFQILNHWNKSIELVHSFDQLQIIKELNFKAGQKAKSSGAYKTALNFFETSLSLPGSKQELQFELRLECAECRYLCEQYTESLNLLEEMEKDYTQEDNFLKISIIKARLFTQWNKLSEVQTLFIHAMNKVGYFVPQSQSGILAAFAVQLIKAKIKMIGKTTQTLKEMPLNSSARETLLLSLYIGTASAIFTQNQNLYILSSLIMFLLLLEKGNHPGGCFPYSSFGVIHTALNDYKTAYQFGLLSLDAGNMYPERKDDYWRMQYIFNQFMKDWVDPIRKTVGSMDGLELKLYESGDPIYAGYSIIARGVKHIFISSNLSEFLQNNEKHLNYFFITKNQICYNIFSPIVQSIKCLAGQTSGYNSLSSGDFDEEADIKQRFTHETPMVRGYYCCYKLLALFHMGFYEEAGKLASESYQYIPYFLSMLMEVELSFYIGVSLLASLDNKKKTNKKTVKKILKKFKKYSELQPENYLHKYCFLIAENERANGNNLKASDYYIRTIDECSRGGYTLIEAKAYERLSRLEEVKKNSKLAMFYLSESYLMYESIGARGKISLVAENQTDVKKILLSRSGHRTSGTLQTAQTIFASTSTGGSTSVSANQLLDYETIIKSSQKLSAEIDLNSLLNQLLDILITNAGATKGIYFFVNGSQYMREVTRYTRDEQNEEFPKSVLQNVLNKKKEVVVNNTVSDAVFNRDEYIKKYNPKSLLCTPIIKNKEVRGLLYLENDLTTDAFTEQRLELLNVLASQAAISIENARLFEDMQRLNEANQKFVPTPLLSILEKSSITDLKLGDQTQKEMTVLFSDIRDFTAISEQMSPQENFNFINSYLSRMGPHVRKNHGFIDKYIGDAVMALFPRKSEDAIHAGIDMQREVILYNNFRKKRGYEPISIGVGIHTGNLMLGIIGETERMEGTVISDTVNLASRLEGLTKMYGVSLIVSEDTLLKVDNIDELKYRLLDTVIVKGKQNSIRVYQIFEGLSREEEDLLQATKLSFELGIEAYLGKRFEEALELFQNVKKQLIDDVPAAIYMERCRKVISEGVSDDWTGVARIMEK